VLELRVLLHFEEDVAMLRIIADAKPGDPALEKEVDAALAHFNNFYAAIQTKSDSESGERVRVGLTAIESAAIKTFVGYYLVVGGHYVPQEG
jgi:hypothetical protein